MMKILPQNYSLSRYEYTQKCVQELLPLSPSKVVSDIGAGSGKMRPLIEAVGGQWQGFDLCPQSPDIQFWDLDYSAPSDCESAGIICLLDVLEHWKNPWLALQHLADSLLPGGFLILTVPNPRWSRSRFETVATGYPTCFTQSDLDLNHHVFTPWPHIVEKLLNDTGLSLKSYATLDGSTSWPSPPYNLRYPVRCVFALFNMMIEKYDTTACGMSYGLVAQKETV